MATVLDGMGLGPYPSVVLFLLTSWCLRNLLCTYLCVCGEEGIMHRNAAGISMDVPKAYLQPTNISDPNCWSILLHIYLSPEKKKTYNRIQETTQDYVEFLRCISCFKKCHYIYSCIMYNGSWDQTEV